MAAPTVKDLKERRAQAEREWLLFKPLYDEAYEFAIPYRRGLTYGPRGEKRVDRTFDMTAIVSAFRFAGRLQQDLCPPGEQWLKLEPGPLVPEKEREQLAKDLAVISEQANAMFMTGEWDLAFHEMGLDLSAGTGAMVIDDAPQLWQNRGKLATFAAVPSEEVLLEPGLFGDVGGVFWKRKFPGRLIKSKWPKGNLSERLAKQIEEKPNDDVEICQDLTLDYDTGIYSLAVYHCEDAAPIFTREYRASPWLTPRYFRVPGETWGRGPVMLAMPAIKTLNKAQELTLKAAAITMLGIYTAAQDGVFNPSTAVVAPGQFWKVRSNGGVLGPTISKLPEPRIDLAQIVLNELRMSVQSAMMDQSLPADGAAVRSATEILERVKRLASDHVGAFGRLVHEIVLPAGARALEIAYDAKIISTDVSIDQLLVKTRITSPIAVARYAAQAQKSVEYAMIVRSLMSAPPGSGEDLVLDKIPLLMDIGRGLGVPERHLVDEKRRAEIQERVKALVAQAMAVAQQAAQAQGAPGQPAPIGAPA
ncbi:portal protein [Xanthobacter versatilis]|uniref:portal protein n=1 Tax=Xanthobacter autotrophicus (strain ATCC BAA-1158 / Py2) TaxID=78245 RepID=UPI003729B7EC